jgi:hypothetical protein
MRGQLRSSGELPASASVWSDVVTAPDWHDELVLMAELSSVNNQIARFVLRLLDADAGRKEQVSVADEGNLGLRLVDLGYALQDRAVHRAITLENGGMAIEVPVSIRRQIESGRGMSTAGSKP